VSGDEQCIVSWVAAEPVDVDDAGIARRRRRRRPITGLTAPEK
jgi:hypothetical protein